MEMVKIMINLISLNNKSAIKMKGRETETLWDLENSLVDLENKITELQ